jgi:hypothetical protein
VTAPADGTAFGGMYVVDGAVELLQGLLPARGDSGGAAAEFADSSDTMVGYAEYCALDRSSRAVGMLFAGLGQRLHR